MNLNSNNMCNQITTMKMRKKLKSMMNSMKIITIATLQCMVIL